MGTTELDSTSHGPERVVAAGQPSDHEIGCSDDNAPARPIRTTSTTLVGVSI